MTKRILSFLIVLGMLVSVLPALPVVAEVSDPTLTKHTHSDAHTCGTQCSGSVTWTALEMLTACPRTAVITI